MLALVSVAVFGMACGQGDPLQRDPKLVLQDVRNGIYTPAYAQREFAVVIHPETLTIDHDATSSLRAGTG